MASDGSTSTEASDGDGRITLEMLHAVEHEASLSQRGLAARLNIALGLTNAYLKRCIRKGLVKAKRIPPNRYAYYVTPKGFSEKTRLTANYLYSSFEFYRQARNQCDEILQALSDGGRTRIALAGAGELAEIAILCAMQHDIEIAAVVDPRARANHFRHVALVRDMASLRPVDAVLICDLKSPQQTFDRLAAEIGEARILAPALLKISRTPEPSTAGAADMETD